MKNNGMIFDAIISCSAVFGVALQMLLNGGKSRYYWLFDFLKAVSK